jgi:hypothetical protein
MYQPPGRRQEILLGVLGIDPRLERMPTDFQLLLAQRQGFAAGHAQLPFDEILPGDHFGDRMLDLQAGVHFHEIEASVLPRKCRWR